MWCVLAVFGLVRVPRYLGFRPCRRGLIAQWIRCNWWIVVLDAVVVSGSGAPVSCAEAAVR